MLIEFRVENYRSLREEQVLSMEAGRGGDASDGRPRHVEGVNLDLLPVVALYGANASGKTNLLNALAFMRNAVFYSANLWQPNQKIPREPFAWGTGRSQPSLFEAVILIDSIRYQYGFLLSDESVLEEWLYAWPHGKKQTWFERDGTDFKFGANLKGDNKIVEGVTRSNALFLSTAIQFKQLQLNPVFDWFRRVTTLNFGELSALSDVDGSYYSAIARLFEKVQGRYREQAMKDRFMTILQKADLGIIDVRVERETRDREIDGFQFFMKHQSNEDSAWLPLSEESKGTQSLFRAAVPLLQAILTGGVLLCDELESSLHPVLAQTIVGQFNDPVTNPRNSQLIFTTHDTNLLGTTLGDEPVLRRDQVWLTEKNAEGATLLYPLTDFKPRKHENLERGYIQGRYGAVPYLGSFTLAAE